MPENGAAQNVRGLTKYFVSAIMKRIRVKDSCL